MVIYLLFYLFYILKIKILCTMRRLPGRPVSLYIWKILLFKVSLWEYTLFSIFPYSTNPSEIEIALRTVYVIIIQILYYD